MLWRGYCELCQGRGPHFSRGYYVCRAPTCREKPGFPVSGTEIRPGWERGWEDSRGGWRAGVGSGQLILDSFFYAQTCEKPGRGPDRECHDLTCSSNALAGGEDRGMGGRREATQNLHSHLVR